MLSTEQLLKLEEVLTAGCEKHLGDGGNLIYGMFSNSSKGCCPVWASIDKELLESKKGQRINLIHFCLIKAVGFTFSELEMLAFISGYDGLKHNEGSDEMYALGQKFRTKYVEIEVEAEKIEAIEAAVVEDES